MLDFPYRLEGTLLQAGRYTATGWEVHCYRLGGIRLHIHAATGLGGTLLQAGRYKATYTGCYRAGRYTATGWEVQGYIYRLLPGWEVHCYRLGGTLLQAVRTGRYNATGCYWTGRYNESRGKYKCYMNVSG